MRNGICVKCGEADVRKLAAEDDGAAADLYFCGTCGYMEQYVAPQELASAVEQSSRVDPTGTQG